MAQFLQDGENGQNVALFLFFWSSAVTKRFDFLDFSQLFWRDFARGILKILALAHLEPELELFEFWEIMVPQIIITIITHVINFKHL